MYEKTGLWCLSLPLLAIQPDRDRSIAEQLYIHVRPEHASYDLQPIGSYHIHKTFTKRLSDGGRSGIRKTRAASFAGVSIESELGDDQNFSPNIEKRTIHLAFIVAKDAQMDNFISQGLDLNLTIVLPYSKQHQQPLTYLADNLFVNRDAGMAHTLE